VPCDEIGEGAEVESFHSLLVSQMCVVSASAIRLLMQTELCPGPRFARCVVFRKRGRMVEGELREGNGK